MSHNCHNREISRLVRLEPNKESVISARVWCHPRHMKGLIELNFQLQFIALFVCYNKGNNYKGIISERRVQISGFKYMVISNTCMSAYIWGYLKILIILYAVFHINCTPKPDMLETRGVVPPPYNLLGPNTQTKSPLEKNSHFNGQRPSFIIVKCEQSQSIKEVKRAFRREFYPKAPRKVLNILAFARILKHFKKETALRSQAPTGSSSMPLQNNIETVFFKRNPKCHGRQAARVLGLSYRAIWRILEKI